MTPSAQRPRGSRAYCREDDEPGFAQLRLRSRFVHEVEVVCPDAIAEYEAMLPLANSPTLKHDLTRWARKYHLDADWFVRAAAAGLRVAAAGGSRRPLITVAFSPPTTATEMTFGWPSYDGSEDPSQYRTRHLEAFAERLDTHLRDAEQRHDSEAAANEPFIEKRTLASVRHAALWQTMGTTSGGDARRIRGVLDRIGLTPREGLSTAASSSAEAE